MINRMFSKVFFATFVIGLHGEVPDIKCYSCEALDKHLPMSNCYFIDNNTGVTTCQSQCLFFQYIVPDEEYIRYDEEQKENTTVKGNVAHTVRSCAPANVNDTCIVNATGAAVRQCIVCDTDLCNASSRKTVSTLSMLLYLIPALSSHVRQFV